MKTSHNDAPPEVDALGRKEFVSEVCNAIRDCDPPKGIAVTGYWGTGKTTLLHAIKSNLDPQSTGRGSDTIQEPGADGKAIATVWFEAWRYQHDALPIVGLLHEIRAGLASKHKLLDGAKKLGALSLRGALSAIDEVVKALSLGLVAPKIGDIEASGEKWEQAHQQVQLPSESLRTLLDQAILAALGDGGRLVILVDDLDRCEGKTIVRLLEGIKLYLNLSHCVVVFALDPRQIEEAIAGTTESGAKGDVRDYTPRHRAREYLEKICQDVFRLPLPTQGQKSSFLRDLIKDLTPLESATHWDPFLSRLAPVLAAFDCLPANPRKLKVLANHIALMLRRNIWALKDPIRKLRVAERAIKVLNRP